MKKAQTLVVALLVVVAAIQLVPVQHDNPPIAGPLTDAPAPVAAALHRACFDCHSHETVWPWYSYIAPASWLVAHDVHEGRRHLNFSEWQAYTAKERGKKLAGISELVQEKEMPPWFYLPLHANAKLSDEDSMRITNWADGIE